MPAGQEPGDVRPTALRRGRLRKRLRYVQRQRELLLRDLGGLVFEIHRSGAPRDEQRHGELVEAKVQRLAAIDAELSAGLASLAQASAGMPLREPGIGGLCPNCGEIYGSDARFCSACGTPVSGRAAVAPAAPASAQPTPLPPVAHPEEPALPSRAATPTTPVAGETAVPATARTSSERAHTDPPAEPPGADARTIVSPARAQGTTSPATPADDPARAGRATPAERTTGREPRRDDEDAQSRDPTGPDAS